MLLSEPGTSYSYDLLKNKQTKESTIILSKPSTYNYWITRVTTFVSITFLRIISWGKHAWLGSLCSTVSNWWHFIGIQLWKWQQALYENKSDYKLCLFWDIFLRKLIKQFVSFTNNSKNEIKIITTTDCIKNDV